MNQAHRRLAPKGAEGKYLARPDTHIHLAREWGFSLLELMIVVSLVALLAVIAIPNFLQSRQTANRTACISNLRQIEEVSQTWAMEHQKAVDSPVTYSDIIPYLNGSVSCPAGPKDFLKSYSLATVADPPTCLIVPETHWLLDQAGRPGRKKPKPPH
jgi:prepilin-type N-terminal cleavage/methylation domain-containing protein